MKVGVVGCLVVIVLTGITGLLAAESQPVSKATLIASPEKGWPQWRGPRRDNICDETGLLQKWPEEGPKLIWKISGLGRGYSAPIITGGRIYIAGDVGDELRISAFDLDGKLVWQAKNGQAWKGHSQGARASCAFSDGNIYHMNAHGRVVCLEAATGKEAWAVNVLERFEGKNITWALSENLLVDGNNVIVTPGGVKGVMAALDKKTGATVWNSGPLRLGKSELPAHQRLATPEGDADGASYTSPILFTQGGRRHLVSCSSRHIFGVDADSGELLWTRPAPTRYLVIANTPVLVDDAVFFAAPDQLADGAGLYRVRTENRSVKVEKLWSSPIDTCHAGLIYRDGMLYGSWYRKQRLWGCIDGRTGEVRYQLKDLAMGTPLYADGRLYCLSQNGEMALIKPTPTAFEYTGRFRPVTEPASDVWTYPVILDSRLYLRHHDTFFCYDIKEKKAGS